MNLLIYGATELGYMITLRLYQEHNITIIDALDKEDDNVIFMGLGPALDTLAAEIFQASNHIKTAVLIGGGSVGFMLAQKLEKAGIRVKLIEQDKGRCVFLADNLKKSLVLHGDGTDLKLLEEESIGDADVSICITNNNEKNLLCSLLIKQLAPDRRLITRVSNAPTAQIFERVGIDVVVSPRESALTELLNRMQSRDVDLLALVEGGQGEVLRLTLPENFPPTRLLDLKFQARAIIGVIKRGRHLIIPSGKDLIQAGDQLKIFTMAEDGEAVKTMFI